MRFLTLSLVLFSAFPAVSESSIDENDSSVVAMLLLANDIDHSHVSDVVHTGENHNRVVSLNLRERGIDRLPPQIILLDSLFSLDLSRNDLTHLDAELWKLPALKTLDLSHNDLETLPDSIVKLELGYSFQDEDGLAHIVLGLSIDSNRICNPDSSIAQWITANTDHSGNPTWRNTQHCESGIKRSAEHFRVEAGIMNRSRSFGIWDLRGRAAPVGYVERSGERLPARCVIVRRGEKGKIQFRTLIRN